MYYIDKTYSVIFDYLEVVHTIVFWFGYYQFLKYAILEVVYNSMYNPILEYNFKHGY